MRCTASLFVVFSIKTNTPKVAETTRRAGFTLIELLVSIAIIALLLGLLLPAIQKVRASVARVDCQNRMKQLALGLHNYHTTAEVFPAGMTVKLDSGKTPYLSWFARILPYVEQPTIWKNVEDAFKSDPNVNEFYGHPPHEKNLATHVKLYTCPADTRISGAVEAYGLQVAVTDYQGVQGIDQKQLRGILRTYAVGGLGVTCLGCFE